MYRRVSWLLVAVLPLVLFSGCGCTTVKPGYEGIRVNMYGQQRGVDDLPIVTGWVWYNPITEEIYNFPTFMQTVTWTKSPHEGHAADESITFNSMEGAGVNADVTFAYSIKPDKVPHVFVKMRKDIEYITNTYLRGKVRDALNQTSASMKIIDIVGPKKGDLLKQAKDLLTRELEPEGYAIDMLSFIGQLRVDQKVEDSINATITATQKAIEAENKVKQSKAEADQKIEEARGKSESTKVEAEGEAKAISLRAAAQAEANKLLSQSLTPEVVSFQALQKWDGVMPLVTSGDGTMPFLQLKPPARKGSTP